MYSQEDVRTFTVVINTARGLVTLDPSDIIQFYFIEDIFSMSLVGKIIMKDNRGLVEFAPLTGNETISISYGEEETIDKEFRIYSVSKIDKLENVDPSGKNVIELFFTDKMFFPINFLQFSKSWGAMRITDIIKSMGEKMLGIEVWDKFEKSNEFIEGFYSPYWNLATCMKWLMKRASGSTSKKTGYCFYNNVYGSNLITLNTLLEQKELMKISSEDDGIYTFEDPNLFLYNKILNWSMMGIDNSALRFISGGTRFGFNDAKKKFIKNEYLYRDIIKNHTILGNKTLFNDISNSNSFHLHTNENDPKIVDNIFNDFWIKKYSTQQCISFTVKGHEKRKCGEIIEVNWPSIWADEIYNKNLQGKYLIKSITHSFVPYSRPAFTQKMVCIKNGYEESDVTELLDSVNKNVSN